MSTKLNGALVGGALALGILVGAAGTVLVHDATRPTMSMADATEMTRMMELMGGDMMGGDMMGGEADHEAHHPGTER